MTPEYMRVRDALDLGRQQLEQSGIEDAARDARWFMAAAMGIPRDRLAVHLDDRLNSESEFFFFHFILARGHRKPVSRILGERQFFGRAFQITDDVLDPRPETETLIEAALSEPFENVLDLGTGSGCIALTLLAETPGAVALAADNSAGALATAQSNAARLGVSDRVHFERSDWFDAVGGTFDLIVSNPPYVATDEMAALQPEVRDYEPRMALDGGADGLDAYRAIAEGAPDHLAQGGRLIVEIGPTQAPSVMEIFRKAGLTGIEVFPDLDGRDRVVMGRKR